MGGGEARGEGEARVGVTGEERRGMVAGEEGVAHRLLDRVPKGVEVDAVGHAEREPLADRGSVDEPELVGDQLHDVAGTERAAPNHETEVVEDGARAAHHPDLL